MTDIKRRKITQYIGLGSVVAIPLGAVTSLLATNTLAAMVDPMSDQAKALQYTDTSTKDGSACGGCALYQGDQAESGPCPLFPEQEVKATGWCTAFVAKP